MQLTLNQSRIPQELSKHISCAQRGHKMEAELIALTGTFNRKFLSGNLVCASAFCRSFPARSNSPSHGSANMLEGYIEFDIYLLWLSGIPPDRQSRTIPRISAALVWG